MDLKGQVTTTTLGSHIQTQKGYAFKSKWYSDHGTPIVKVSNLTEDSVDVSNLTCIPDDIAVGYSRYALRAGDIVIQTVGSWPSNPQSVVGKVIQVPSRAAGALLNQNAVRIDPNQELDKGFLFYLLKGQWFKEYIIGCAQGAASQASITLEAIRTFRFPLPPLSTQCKIVSVLSAYDDLIENNSRRIQILEEMAQAIYREWFVNFRFPGHEQVRMVESRLGAIPKEWQVSQLGSVCNLVMGQSPKSEYYNNKGEGLPFHQGVTDFGRRFPTDRLYCTVENRVAEAGDILFSVRAPVGRINLTTKKMVIGRGLSAIRSKSGDQAFTFHQLKDRFQDEDSMGGGTIFKAVTKSDMLSIELIQPEDWLVKNFESLMRPVFREIENLTAKNSNLSSTRNLLLPKLISGEVSVEDVSERVPG